MAATLAQLLSYRAALVTALASGVKSVQHGDTRTEFQSVADIQRAIAAVEGEMALAGGAQIVRSIKLTSSKDL